MQTELVKQLTDVLDQENEIYETLSKISDNKTDLIVSGKVVELGEVVKIEQALIIKISKLEDKREKIVDKLCAVLGRKPEEMTISSIALQLGQEDSDMLKACQARMLKCISKLKGINELNSKLIKNSIEYIDFSVNMMTSVDTMNNSYGSSGHEGDTKKRNLFDVKL